MAHHWLVLPFSKIQADVANYTFDLKTCGRRYHIVGEMISVHDIRKIEDNYVEKMFDSRINVVNIVIAHHHKAGVWITM